MALGGGGGGGKASASAVKAGEAFVEISADDSKFVSATKRVANRIYEMGNTFKKTGANIALAGTAALTPILGLFHQSLKLGDSMTKAAERMGASAEAASKLAYAAKQSDTELEAVVGANAKLTKAALAAAGGSEEQAEAFAALGISAENFLEMDADDRFIMIAEALEKTDSEITKNKIGFGLLGKSFKELEPLLNSGGQGLRELFEEAEKVGAVISTDRAKKSTEIGDTIDKTWTAVKMTFLEVGFALLGLQGEITKSSNVVIDTLQSIREWINQNRVLVITVTLIAAGLVAGGTALIAFGMAMQGLIITISAAIAVGKVFIAVLLSPIIVKGAIVIATLIGLAIILREVFGLLQGFNGLGTELSAVFRSMGETFMETFGIMGRFIEKGDIRKAFEALWIGVQIVWHKGLLAIQLVWNAFKASFVDGWHDIGASLRLILNDLAAWMLRTIGSMFNGILEGMARALDLIDATETAAAVRGAKVDTSSINAGRDDEAKRILNERRKQQLESNKARDEAIRKEKEIIDGLQKQLDILNAQSQVPAPAPVQAKPRPKPEDFKPSTLNLLGSAVRGTFSSSDFKGALGLGPANSEAKKQTDLLTKQLKVLKQIEAKDGGIFD